MHDNVDHQIQELAKQFKANSAPAQEHDLQKLLEDMKANNVSNPAIPKDLEKLWKVASEWHLIEDHIEVFGFNIYSPTKLIGTTLQIFGDKEIKTEWAQEQGDNSCAGSDWLCLAGYSEFDYVFVNLNEKSPFFGSTRHMVNNTGEEHEASKAPFSNFITYANDKCEQYFKDVAEDEEECV